MTNEKAIKYLQQLYPNGGHCWLDEQRIEAIGMAVKALQEEPANNSFEDEVKKLWEEINTGHSYSIVDSYNQFYGLCTDIADWQKKQMMAKAVDATVHIDAGGYPYIPQMELYDYYKDVPLAKEGDKYKVVLIKEE